MLPWRLVYMRVTAALVARLSPQVGQLRVILEGIEARAHEREWLKLQARADGGDRGVTRGPAGT